MADLIQDWLLDPVALLFLLSALTVFLLIRRRSRSLNIARPSFLWTITLLWLIFYLVCTSPVIVNPLLSTMENRYPSQNACEQGSHVVVLAGGVDSRVSNVGEFERMSVATLSRATQGARFALAEPSTRLIVSGGPLKTVAEADVIASYWIALGISDERIVRENQSANTRENSVNVAQILTLESVKGPVRLVTSALHMTRAMLSFEKALQSTGVELCPVSVERLAIANLPLWAWIPQTTAIVKFDKWLHEIAALAVYRLNDWI